MVDRLINYFEKYSALNQEERFFLQEHIEVRKLQKNDFLLREGEVSEEFYFIVKGSVRLFYLKDIEEKTAFFYTEETFVSSYESFTKGLAAKHNLQCMEECELLVISQSLAQKLLDRFPKFELLARIMMESELIIYQEIISSFVSRSPTERYLQLLETQGALLQRIPLHQLATYLGVRAETLSRIRRKVAGKSSS
ncbi:MAG: Crp/Fnr family transcriptional regulator [Croceimicrobium sp.]|nr:Crp/Fnr family transcriptional regulator [Bacteroidota bacterium]